MFGNILRRINRLEERMDCVDAKNKCAQGIHKWIIRDADSLSKPFIRCEHCYAKPEDEA